MNDTHKQPFTFTSEIVNQLIDHDWEISVISGGGPGGLSFDELRAGRWSEQDIHRIRTMDFVPSTHDDTHVRHRFVLHALDGYLDHMIETHKPHGWKTRSTNTLAAFATNKQWIGQTTINPGVYHAHSSPHQPHVSRRMIQFEPLSIERVTQLIHDVLVDSRAVELIDFDW